MRAPHLATEECFALLKKGYILKNEHGYTTRLKKGKQYISNWNRIRKRPRNFAYQFDYPTWQISDRISFIERLQNIYFLGINFLKEKFTKTIKVSKN